MQYGSLLYRVVAGMPICFAEVAKWQGQGMRGSLSVGVIEFSVSCRVLGYKSLGLRV